MPEHLASERPAQLPRLTRFEVIRRIGEGGSGLVYEAVDRERHTNVALKMLRVLDGEMLLRMKEEFRALQDIEHPNLIRLFELSCDEGTWFYTMELVDGVAFTAYVSGDGESRVQSRRSHTDMPTGKHERTGARSVHPPPQRGAADYGRLRESLSQLARGLVVLHAAGKVHRDIKPSNVLVARDGRVVILDLGLVRDSTDRHDAEADVVVGTISHMAPEQAAGEDVGPAADWYSVGTVLYQCLTGRNPFEGGAFDVLSRKQTEDPPRPRDLVPDVPADLDALCMALLSRDATLRPSGDEVVFTLENRALSDRPAARPGGQTPFVGREAEIKALRASFDKARATGAAVTVIVEGESGVGKSVLVRRVTKALQEEHGVLVLSGRCYEREDVPYKAIDGVIDALSHHLTSLSADLAQEILPATAFVLAYAFPVLRRVPGMELGKALRLGGLQESRSLLFHALRELFANLAAKQATAIVIDDLQWADADSLAALAEILRPPSPPLLLIATARALATRDAPAPSSAASPEDASPFGLPGDVRVLPVPRLTEAEGLELVTMLGAELPPEVAQRIAAEAHGHPLFVDELVRHAELHGGEAPADLRLDDALFARVSRLEDGARRLLEILAVAGVALKQEVAMRASGLAFSDFSSSVQTLRTAHLARTDGWRGEDAIEAYHDRVREAVAARLEESVRKRWHARLAETLEAEATKDADALSQHWEGAGDLPKAGEYARAAAEQAREALAFESAARSYERALMLAKMSDADRQELRLKLGEALVNAGRGREAAQAFFDAAAAAPADLALDLRRRAAEELLAAGRLDEGEAVLHDVLRAVSIHMPKTPLIAALGLLFYRFVLFLRGLGYKERGEREIPAHALTRLDAFNGVGRILALVDTVRGAYFQTRGLLEGLRVGEPNRLAFALAIDAVYSATAGDAARAEKLTAQASAIVERVGNMQLQCLVEVVRGFCALVLGRLPEALKHTDAGTARLKDEAPGAFWDKRTSLLAGIWAVGWMGNLKMLADRVERAAREAELRGDLYQTCTLRTGVPNLTWLRKGDPAAARAIVLEAMRQWTQRGYHSQHYWSLLALTRIDLYEGDARGAYARVTREWSLLSRALIMQVRLMGLEALHMRASATLAVAADEKGSERATLIKAALADAGRIGRMRWSLAAPFIPLIQATAASLEKDEAKMVTELAAAARGFEGTSMALHAAICRWHLGRAQGGDQGRRLVTDAEAWMTSQGIASPSRMAGTIAPGFRR
jgi:tetratricopeptide (TPR) repeat protein